MSTHLAQVYYTIYHHGMMYHGKKISDRDLHHKWEKLDLLIHEYKVDLINLLNYLARVFPKVNHQNRSVLSICSGLRDKSTIPFLEKKPHDTVITGWKVFHLCSWGKCSRTETVQQLFNCWKSAVVRKIS